MPLVVELDKTQDSSSVDLKGVNILSWKKHRAVTGVWPSQFAWANLTIALEFVAYSLVAARRSPAICARVVVASLALGL